MRAALLIAIAVVIVVYLLLRSRRSSILPNPQTGAGLAGPASPEAIYQGLRNMVLCGTRERFGLAPGSVAEEVWGVVMDWGVANGTATVMALSDGSASIYLSSGGGYLGGQKEASVREAARKAVAAAQEFYPKMRPAKEYALPASGEVIFYVLTDGGVFTAMEKEIEIRNPEHPLARLGSSMQNVVTQYRILEEFKK